MSEKLFQAASGLYTTLAAGILGTWVLVALGLSAAAVRVGHPTISQLIAMPSLLTFLVCRLVTSPLRRAGLPQRPTGATAASSSPSSPPRRRNFGTLTRWIATADHGSPQGALALLLFSGVWLRELLIFAGGLFMITLLAFSTASLENPEETEVGIRALHPDWSDDYLEELHRNTTTELNAFEASTGISKAEVRRAVPGRMLAPFVLAVWSSAITLFMYVAALMVGSVKVVLSSPKEAWSRDRDEAAFAMVKEEKQVVLWLLSRSLLLSLLLMETAHGRCPACQKVVSDDASGE